VIDPTRPKIRSRNRLGSVVREGFSERVQDGAALLEQWDAAMTEARAMTGE
jgi:hypothetical protein